MGEIGQIIITIVACGVFYGLGRIHQMCCNTNERIDQIIAEKAYAELEKKAWRKK